MRRSIVSSIRWLRWPLLTAACALTVVVALGSTPTLAAPVLTAAPQTVTLADCRDTGTSTLSWTGVTPTVPPATQTDLYINNALVKSALPTSGTHTLTVTGNNTYSVEVRETTVLGRPQTVATVTVTSICRRPSPPPPPPPACPKQCFSSTPSVTPHGTFATITVTTHAPTRVGILVSTQPPDGLNQFPTAAIVAKASSQGTAATTHTLDLFGLQAKTGYHFVVEAKDATDVTFTTKGTFTTLTRRVEVHFEKVFIIDDSDNGSEGDLEFWFWANTAPMKSIEAEADSGETVTALGGAVPLALFLLDDAPATLKLGVRGCDNDIPDIAPGQNVYACLTGGSGSTAEADWSTKEQAFDLKKTGLDETYAAQFSMTADGSPLRFTVHGIYKVSYV